MGHGYNSTCSERGDANMDVLQIASMLTLYILLTVAVIQDFRHMKVSNRLIFIGLGLGIFFQTIQKGPVAIVRVLPNIIIPVIVLYLLFLMRCLGAGDIKLFSVIGTFINFKQLGVCIAAAFVIGAVFALLKMLSRKNLWNRLFLVRCYVVETLQGNVAPYSYKSKEDVLHFSLAIALGLAVTQLTNCFGIW